MSIKTYKLPISIVIWILIEFIMMINGAKFECPRISTDCECANGTVICVGSKNPNGIDIIRLKPPRLEIKCSEKNVSDKLLYHINCKGVACDFLPQINVGELAEELFIENCMLSGSLSLRQIVTHFNISRWRTINFSTKSKFVFNSWDLRDLKGVESVHFDGPITFANINPPRRQSAGGTSNIAIGGKGGHDSSAFGGVGGNRSIAQTISRTKSSGNSWQCKSTAGCGGHVISSPHSRPSIGSNLFAAGGTSDIAIGGKGGHGGNAVRGHGSSVFNKIGGSAFRGVGGNRGNAKSISRFKPTPRYGGHVIPCSKTVHYKIDMSLDKDSITQYEKSPFEISFTKNTNSKSMSEILLMYAAHLERVYLMGNDFQTLDSNLFQFLINLKDLSLANNNLETLPDKIFQNQQKLIELDISFNRLRTMENVIFECYQTLIVLSLSHNHLEYIPDVLLTRLSALKELYLDNNLIKTITYDVSSSLKIVKLGNNSLTRIWHPSNKELTTLDLSCNRIEHLDLSDFIPIRNVSFTVNLTKNWIRSIYNNNTAYKFIKTELKKYADAMKRPEIQWDWILNDNPLKCDCESLHFSNILNERADIRKYLNLITNKLECNANGKLNGKLISQVDPSDLLCPYNCSIIANKSAACECWIRSFDNVLIVNCSNMALTKVPNLLSLSKKSNFFERIELIIANNNIKILSFETMPDNIYKINAENNSFRIIETEGLSTLLNELNLAGNNLQTLDRSFLLRLNGTLNKLKLQRNPWTCDCSGDFMNYMKMYPNKVNYTSIRCSDGKSLSETEQMCSQHFKILLIVYTIVGFLFGGLIALYYKFKLEIKIWLFANEICLCLVQEYEIDEDKEYDAFMSYSYKDQEFVDALTLKLESGPNPFRVCIDSRDFIIGEFIADQIATSVKNSRRTIVVLSNAFLKSVWGKMEFRAAHKLALEEGRTRLIVIMKEEIEDSEQLSPELSLYLKTNTYLKCDDPYFYNKLYYALPHSPGNCKAKGHK